jgi:hypothetical protein
MKNKLKIVNENGMYVGYALKNDEVVFKTNPCKDTISCSRALSQYAGNQTTSANPLPTPKGNRITQITSSTPTASLQRTAPVQSQKPASPAPRRCCGRG